MSVNRHKESRLGIARLVVSKTICSRIWKQKKNSLSGPVVNQFVTYVWQSWTWATHREIDGSCLYHSEGHGDTQKEKVEQVVGAHCLQQEQDRNDDDFQGVLQNARWNQT